MDKHLIKELKCHQYSFIYVDAVPYLSHHLCPTNMCMDCFVFIIVLAFIKFYHMFIHTHIHNFIVL